MNFRMKLSLSLMGIAAASTVLALGVDVYFSRKFMLMEVKSKVMSIAASTASQINGDLAKQIRTLDDEKLPAYKTMRKKLRKARNANRRPDIYIKYLYTFYPDPNDPGKFYFSVDPEESEKDVSHAGTVNPGATTDRVKDHLYEVYSLGTFTKDPWGVWMTGYAPVFDAQGNYVASLGADVAVAHVQQAINRLYLYGFFSFLLSISLALLIARLLSTHLVKSLNELKTATLKIGEGELSYRINLNSEDEFQELADAINKMTEGLEEKERLKTGFAHYVSQHVLDRIVKSKGSAVLEGERRKITVFFSDIREFTHIAETMPPEKVVVFLNEYFKRMLEIIFKHNGMLDKLIGDGIMAEFGVPIEDPEQERNAVLTALEMQESLKALNEKWKSEGKPTVEIGIGIHTGEAIVGSVGSEQRMEYTAIGDTVNIASRLEHVTKEKNVQVVVSESTFRALYNEFPSKNLGFLTLQGKDQPINAYAISMPEGKTIADLMHKKSAPPETPKA